MNLRVAAVVLALAAFTGCVTVPEFRKLEREVVELKRGSEAGGGASGARLADLGEEVAGLRDEVARLRGAVEQAQHSAESAMEEARRAQQAPPAGSTASGGAPSGAGAGAGAGTGVVAGTAAGSAREEISAYEEAFTLYRAKEYEAAIDRFGAFLQTHPSSDYADNAQFWLAECYFKLGDYEQAVLAFEEVVEKFPKGNKVPDALYRQGIAMLEIGRETGQEARYRPAARQIFERLVSNYPESERVPEARRQLEKLGT
ncbi:MAG: tol-pal system protein YbgF [Deltaproteobacteria bacterium]|nr:tol-pal system protein YbgF [Deltaproteobacteria bacterium]MBW2413715.1 tol-pal system protein YbgF [Deltaproteobacteria bacterium]